MSQMFSVDPASLRRAGSSHDQAARELVKAIDRLRACLVGAPWGNDKPGTSFGDAHGRNEARVLAALDELVEVVSSVGDGLRSTATNYEGADAASEAP